MRALLLTAILAFSLNSPLVFAHGSHGVDSAEAISIVYASVPKLADKDYGFEVGQLPKSWKSLTRNDVAVVETDGDFYVMSATNSESKSVIYLLIGINGRILGVKNTNDF